MVSTPILLSAAVMGFTGGPHCLAMCGAACVGLARPPSAFAPPTLIPFWLFQLGRLCSYCFIGSLAALTMQSLGWLTTQSAAIRPIWSLIHVLGIVWGGYLFVFARQPLWLDSGASRLWKTITAHPLLQNKAGPFILGCVWVLLPCSLLYSALLLAALSSTPLGGALAMGVFALCSGLSLWLGVRLWLRFSAERNAMAMRIAGLCLAGLSAYGLYMGLVHQTAPWCIT